MSVQALGWVLDHSPARGTDRLVLISLANHARTRPVDGAWESYPGVETIRMEAGLDRGRTVPSAIARLEAAGLIERIVNGAPDTRIRNDRRPNLYRISLARGVPCGDRDCRYCERRGMTPHDTPRGDHGVSPRVTRKRAQSAPRGDASRRDGVTPDDLTGCRRASPEPNDEPLVQPKSKYIAPPKSSANATNDAEVVDAEVVEPGTLLALAPTAKPTRTRPPDLIFEALAEVAGMDWRNGLTKSERGKLNAAARELRDVGATADEVRRRGAAYLIKFTTPLTPHALANNWSSLADAGANGSHLITRLAVAAAFAEPEEIT